MFGNQFDAGALRKIGRTDGAVIPAGLVGEAVVSTVASASAVALVSGVYSEVTRLSLTPGLWLVYGNVAILSDAATAVITEAAGTLRNGAVGGSSTAGFEYRIDGGATISNVEEVNGRAMRILNITGNADIYLNARAIFGAGVVKAFGGATAIRLASA